MTPAEAISPPLTARDRFWMRWLPRIRPAPLAETAKRLAGVRRRVVATPDGRFDVDPVSKLGLALCLGGAFEPAMRDAIRDVLPEGGTFVDLGANEGYFTVVGARRVGPAGRVVAVEPQARLLPLIRANCGLNGVSAVVRVEAVAVADRDGERPLYLTTSLNNGGSGLARPTRYPLPTQAVRVERLAALLDRAGAVAVDLMKVDIEGFEYEAVLGSPEVFRAGRVRALALELHPAALAARGKAAADITGFLEACGYRPDPALPTLVYRAPPAPGAAGPG